MKGFVPTPEKIVDLMVEKLFADRPPSNRDSLLDPGCGKGVFIEGVLRWCKRNHAPIPSIIGIELDPSHTPEARAKFKGSSKVEILERDFLTTNPGLFDYVIGNPPYVPITGLSDNEKRLYRSRFKTASGRFDLYLLFFEQALRSLRQGGRLVFITPEKYLYTETASIFRRIVRNFQIVEIQLVEEEAFGKLITYPTITTISNKPSDMPTRIVWRDGTEKKVRLPRSGESWLPHMNGRTEIQSRVTLQDICIRVSCGIATGADSTYVRKGRDLNDELLKFSYPTIAGRELGPHNSALETSEVILSPYDSDGGLLPEMELGALGEYLSRPENQARLNGRRTRARKDWYAFHDSLPIRDIRRQKILCKDITLEPQFWADKSGAIVPRHTVYYIVPKDAEVIDDLCGYLNSESARKWLLSNCQHAAGGFIRLQSSVLKRLPVPEKLCQKTEEGPSNIRDGLRSDGERKRRLAQSLLSY